MMEVDMQSPPPTFRPVAFTIKRPRSPGSPTQERQTKRLNLSLAPIGPEGQGARRASTAPDRVMDGRVACQDDWVRQARELSITSPLSVTVGFPSVSGASPTVAQARVDEHMAVDYEDSQALRVHVYPGGSRPCTTRTHLPSIHITTTPALRLTDMSNGFQAQSPAPFSVLTEPPSSSTDSVSSTSSIAVTHMTVGGPCPPDIFLFPATPSDTPSHQHQLTPDCGHQAGEREPEPHGRMRDPCIPHSPVARAQDRIDGSPRPSRPDIPTSSGRKHRVTMGPRADCMKCRTGVRGHWMHFD